MRRLLAYSAASNSATFDEPAHLAAGVEYLRRHDLTIYSLSPPLLRMWAAIPDAVLAKPRLRPPIVKAADCPSSGTGCTPMLSSRQIFRALHSFCCCRPAGDDSHFVFCRVGNLPLGGRTLWPPQRRCGLRDVLPQSQHPGSCGCAGHHRCRNGGGDAGIVLALVAILPVARRWRRWALACVWRLWRRICVNSRRCCSGRCCWRWWFRSRATAIARWARNFCRRPGSALAATTLLAAECRLWVSAAQGHRFGVVSLLNSDFMRSVCSNACRRAIPFAGCRAADS